MEYPEFTISELIETYSIEREEWIEAGKPLRSAEEIKSIHSICVSCPHFQPKSPTKGNCRLCGCTIKAKGKTLNKAAWGNKKCPDNPSRWPSGSNEAGSN